MIAYNITSTTRIAFIIVLVTIIGYLFCPITAFAQEKQDYWVLTIKSKKHKILPQNKIDTLRLSSNDLKKNLCIAYKPANTDLNINNKLIVIMTSNRQEIARYPLKNGMVAFPMVMFSTITDKIVSINVVQQPKTTALERRVRVGTKLICFLKW